jgi:Flp pilus assembly pilin Flp
MNGMHRRPNARRAFVTDRRGAVAVEYIAIVGTIAIASIPAGFAAGADLVQSFSIVRELLFLPIP